MKSFLTQQFLDPRQDYKKMSNDGGQENKICMNYVVNQHIIFRCTRKNKRLHFILMRKLICSPMSEMSEDTNNMRFIFLCHNLGVERYFFCTLCHRKQKI